jgi:adenosylmethionine-8-amino-7-oxononanoate aminotransferase
MELTLWSEGEKKKQVVATDGYWIEYSDGSKHIDLQCGNAAFILGYSDQAVIQAMYFNPVNFIRGNSGESSATNDELINLICTEGNWESLCWAVSGSDAVEAAIAMNDKYWAVKDSTKSKILCFSPNYHGSTMLTKHLRGENNYLNRAVIVELPKWDTPKRQALFEAMCIEDVRNKLNANPNIGCILMETVTFALGDVTPFTTGFWESLRNLCDAYDVLFIVDDVAMCWVKNGTLFVWQPYGVQPDISTLGKALTAGYSPLGAAVCNKKVSDVLDIKGWDHSQTWSPNMQGVVAALAATRQIKHLLPKVPELEAQIKQVATALNVSIRGSGLLWQLGINKSIAELSALGLSASVHYGSGVKVVIPLIADETYFAELLRRLSYQ